MHERLKGFSATAGLLLAAAALQACNSTNATPSGPPAPPQTILVPGTTNQYSGTETIAITFVHPTVKTPNSNAVYSTAETDTVSAAGAGAPAPYDVRQTITYTTKTPPTYGIQQLSATVDNYENVTAGPGGSQILTFTQDNVHSTGKDFTSIISHGGSGALTDDTQSSYPSPLTLAVYPLTAGASWSVEQARTVMAHLRIAAASGILASDLTMTYPPDGSYTLTGTLTNGDTTNRTQNANGSATETNTGPSPSTGTIGVPTNASGPWLIPVTSNGTAYHIVDYYPGGELPVQPLSAGTVTVVGAVSTLPSSCPVSGTFPNVVEYDSSGYGLDVLEGGVLTTSSRTFDSNGLTICLLATHTTKYYTLSTGLLDYTNATDTSSYLTTTTANANHRAAVRK